MDATQGSMPRWLWRSFPMVLYRLLGQKWIALPWSLAVLLGTAASFIVGFKNVQTYNRTVEAQHVWTAAESALAVFSRPNTDSRSHPMKDLPAREKLNLAEMVAQYLVLASTLERT
ncbi:MAG TPA: hypothetical protein VFU71_23325 [Burkholderiaceae bacterium]|nr:hypothetical protein [Burkholderiaceae bacterium]